MRSYRLITILCCAALLVSCRSSDNKKILPVNTMKQVMWDLLKADEWYARIALKDSIARKKREDIRLYEQVFAVHHITRDQFYSSYKFYEARPVAFKELMDSVDAMSSRERLRTTERHGQAR